MLVGRSRQSSASVARGQKEAVERRYAEGRGKRKLLSEGMPRVGA